MDTAKIALLLAEHHNRELPANYTLLSPAAEVAALLKEHANEKQIWERKEAQAEAQHDKLMAEITTLTYLLNDAITRHQKAMEDQNLKREHRELRILKDKLVDLLKATDYVWRDPIGELFDGDLPQLVNVDGWKTSADYVESRVIQVREPIIYHGDKPIKEGSVVVGGSQSESETPPSLVPRHRLE